MQFEARDSIVSRVGIQHFHILVGAESVNIFGMPGYTYAGPLYCNTYETAEVAGAVWVTLVNNHLDGYFDEAEMADVVEDIIDLADDEEEHVGLEVCEADLNIAIVECWGCIPAHNN